MTTPVAITIIVVLDLALLSGLAASMIAVYRRLTPPAGRETPGQSMVVTRSAGEPRTVAARRSVPRSPKPVGVGGRTNARSTETVVPR
jgi:hypothetical protein